MKILFQINYPVDSVPIDNPDHYVKKYSKNQVLWPWQTVVRKQAHMMVTNTASGVRPSMSDSWLCQLLDVWLWTNYLNCPCLGIFFLLFNFLKNFKRLFILRERERERAHEQGRGRERGRENAKQAPCHHQHRDRHGARTHELRDHALSWNQEADT